MEKIMINRDKEIGIWFSYEEFKQIVESYAEELGISPSEIDINATYGCDDSPTIKLEAASKETDKEFQKRVERLKKEDEERFNSEREVYLRLKKKFEG